LRTPGSRFKVRVKAFNSVGSVTSNYVAVILSSIPNKPSIAQYVSDGNSVTITMS
jgi:hypothetical protein